MESIKRLAEHIECELDAAERYLLDAEKETMLFPEIAKGYYAQSLAKMDAVKQLHDIAVVVIENYRKEKGEPPAPMMAMYNYLHEKHMKQAAQIKALQSMFKL